MEEFIIATLRYGTPLVYVTMAGVGLVLAAWVLLR